MQQQPTDPGQDNTPPKKKKKRGCCFGCSMFLIILLAAVIGVAGYFVYQGFPKKSVVEKEYNQIPEYFEN